MVHNRQAKTAVNRNKHAKKQSLTKRNDILQNSTAMKYYLMLQAGAFQ